MTKQVPQARKWVSHLRRSLGLSLICLLAPLIGVAEPEAGQPPASLEVEHLLYLEGLRLGLDHTAEVISATGNSLRAMAHHGIEEPPQGEVDRSNPIFRQHVAAAARRYWVNKAPRVTPSEQQLRHFYEQTQSDYFVPEVLSFQHLYFRSKENWQQLLNKINNRDVIQSAPYPLGSHFSDISRDQLADRFGEKFAAELFAADQSAGWQGPIRSTLGDHLVLISERKPAGSASLEMIKATLTARWKRQHQERWLETKMDEVQQRQYRPIDHH
jgi:hypothetical protein